MTVSILLTCDIHTHVWGSEAVDADLRRARKTLRDLGLPCTFFFPANSAEMLADHVRGLPGEGHEIGCHGLTHEPDEQYSGLPLARQQKLLTEATERIAAVLGRRPTSFRSPTFKVSGDTVRALEDLGYGADVSINAQRLPVFGSDMYNWRPLFAPRRPYHPSRRDAFTPGDTALWEIPVSAWMLPFVSNTERLLGLGFVRMLFRLLHAESRLTGKPIVFMFHPEELNAERPREARRRLSWTDFVPSPTYGLRFRESLFDRDWRRIERDLVSLVRFMAGFDDVRFLTVRDYVCMLEAVPPTR